MRKFLTGRLIAVAAVAGSALLSAGALSEAASASATATATNHVKFTLTCNAGVAGTQSLSAAMRTVSPAGASPGSTFTITGARILLVVPVSLVNEAYALGVRSFDGTLTAADVVSSDATPTPANVAGNGISIPATTISPNTSAPLYIPGKTSTFSFPAMTFGSSGPDVGSLSEIDVTVNGNDASGQPVVTINAVCQAAPAPLFLVVNAATATAPVIAAGACAAPGVTLAPSPLKLSKGQTGTLTSSVTRTVKAAQKSVDVWLRGFAFRTLDSVLVTFPAPGAVSCLTTTVTYSVGCNENGHLVFAQLVDGKSETVDSKDGVNVSPNVTVSC